MSRIVKRRYADTVTDLNALSRYLESMAAEGLMLRSIDLPNILFGECQQRRVRFNAVVVSGMSEADVSGYVSLCRETGWELLCRYSELFVFITEDMSIPDIDTEKRSPVRIERQKDKSRSWKRALIIWMTAFAAFLTVTVVAVAVGYAEGCRGKTSRSIEDADYWWTSEHCDECVSIYGFELLPIKSGNAVINDYMFSSYVTLLDDSIEIFIDCTYSEEDYARELRRLLSLECCSITADSPNDDREYGSGTFELDDGFQAPAIVQIMLRGEGAEYALLYENECRIVYVYLQYWPNFRLDIDDQYLPLDKRTYHYAP